MGTFANSAQIIAFPGSRVPAVLVYREQGSGGWLSGSLAEACAEADWLAANLDLPVIVGGRP